MNRTIRGCKGPVIKTRRLKRKRAKNKVKRIVRKKKIRREPDIIYEPVEEEDLGEPPYTPWEPDTRPVYEYIPAEVKLDIEKTARPVYSIEFSTDGKVVFIGRNMPFKSKEFIINRIRSYEMWLRDLKFEDQEVKEEFLECVETYFFMENDNIGIAWLRFYSEDYNSARETFEKVLEDDPENAEALAGLGIAKYYLGEKGAYDDCSKAIENDPDISKIVVRYIPRRGQRKNHRRGVKAKLQIIKAALLSSSKEIRDYLLMRDIERMSLEREKNLGAMDKKLEEMSRERETLPKTFLSSYEKQLRDYQRDVNFRQVKEKGFTTPTISLFTGQRY